jgi:hypothetical protein
MSENSETPKCNEVDAGIDSNDYRAWRTFARDLERQNNALRADAERLKAGPVATRVSIHGMYDMHLFHQVTGRTVDEVINNWLTHISELQPAIVGGAKIDDMGPSNLCPAIVLSGEKELRRVGKMVFPDDHTRKPRNPADLKEYRDALLADPDIPRLLAAAIDKERG